MSLVPYLPPPFLCPIKFQAPLLVCAASAICRPLPHRGRRLPRRHPPHTFPQRPWAHLLHQHSGTPHVPGGQVCVGVWEWNCERPTRASACGAPSCGSSYLVSEPCSASACCISSVQSLVLIFRARTRVTSGKPRGAFTPPLRQLKVQGV